MAGNAIQLTVFGDEEEAHTKKTLKKGAKGGDLYRPYLESDRRRLWLRSIERKIDAGPQIRLLGFKMLLMLVEWHQAEMSFEQPELPQEGADRVEVQLPSVDDSDHPFRNLSDEDTASIHEWMFKHYMHLLNDNRTNYLTKMEVIDWISAPLFPAEEIAKYPFSFQACAVCMGVNPEELRSMLLRDIAPKITITFEKEPGRKYA